MVFSACLCSLERKARFWFLVWFQKITQKGGRGYASPHQKNCITLKGGRGYASPHHKNLNSEGWSRFFADGSGLLFPERRFSRFRFSSCVNSKSIISVTHLRSPHSPIFEKRFENMGSNDTPSFWASHQLSENCSEKQLSPDVLRIRELLRECPRSPRVAPKTGFLITQRTAKGASGKGPRQKKRSNTFKK